MIGRTTGLAPDKKKKKKEKSWGKSGQVESSRRWRNFCGMECSKGRSLCLKKKRKKKEEEKKKKKKKEKKKKEKKQKKKDG